VAAAAAPVAAAADLQQELQMLLLARHCTAEVGCVEQQLPAAAAAAAAWVQGQKLHLLHCWTAAMDQLHLSDLCALHQMLGCQRHPQLLCWWLGQDPVQEMSCHLQLCLPKALVSCKRSVSSSSVR
jgi:hypothetical protein